jgi:hypothetical protein
VNLNLCPSCWEKQRAIDRLQQKEYRDRSVIDSQPLRAEPILYQLERARCSRCGKTVQAHAPEVLPKSLYGNQLVTQVVFLHYRQGIPMGRLCGQLGVGLGAVIDILHRMAALFRGVMGKLVEEYRQAPVRHAELPYCLTAVEADGATQHPRPTVAHTRADAPVCPDSTPSPRLRDYSCIRLPLAGVRGIFGARLIAAANPAEYSER